jgi:LPXTG-site transpeptidase (sortase) family protein
VSPRTAAWRVRRHRAGGRRLVTAALVTAALAVAAVVSGALAAASGILGAAEAAWREPAMAGATPTVSAGDAELSGPPARVRIPSIGVDVPLDALHLDATGALEAPTDFQVAGWYADGTVPGDAGPAVIAGHVDSQSGPAVFFRLGELRAGDLVEVERGGEWIAFEVVETTRVPKDEFPTEQVYGPTPDRQLRIITCGGDFDNTTRNYRDNVIVYAVAL